MYYLNLNSILVLRKITAGVYCYVQKETRRIPALIPGGHRSWKRMWWYWSIVRYRHELRDSVARHSLEDASDARRVDRKRGTRNDWRHDLGITSLFDNLEKEVYLKKSQRAKVKRTQRTHVQGSGLFSWPSYRRLS